LPRAQALLADLLPHAGHDRLDTGRMSRGSGYSAANIQAWQKKDAGAQSPASATARGQQTG
jgi:hypothetical protein